MLSTFGQPPMPSVSPVYRNESIANQVPLVLEAQNGNAFTFKEVNSIR